LPTRSRPHMAQSGLSGLSSYLSAFGSEADMGRRILPVIFAAF